MASAVEWPRERCGSQHYVASTWPVITKHVARPAKVSKESG